MLSTRHVVYTCCLYMLSLHVVYTSFLHLLHCCVVYKSCIVCTAYCVHGKLFTHSMLSSQHMHTQCCLHMLYTLAVYPACTNAALPGHASLPLMVERVLEGVVLIFTNNGFKFSANSHCRQRLMPKLSANDPFYYKTNTSLIPGLKFNYRINFISYL
jgi:hypothetical protein